MSSAQQSNPLHEHRSNGRNRVHSKEHALTEREFELLLEGAVELARSDFYYDPDPPLVIYALGRLGLRRSELAHLREEWIDWRAKRINIPAYDPYDYGKDGTICGQCVQSAKQRVDHADELTLDEALQYVWTPKTEAGVRSVYFGHDVRAEMYLERYFDSPEYDRFEASGSAIARRVDRAAELAPELEVDRVYPHALRATCASDLAGRGLGIYQLTQHMGWVKTKTAEHYVSTSPTNTENALDSLDV